LLHAASLGAALLALWLLLSGVYTPLMLLFALASVGLVLVVAARMDAIDHEGHPLHLRLGRTLAYGVWLAGEIARANLDVARRILAPSLPIAPRMVRLVPGQRTDLGRTLYANSITLTPGTVSVKLSEAEVLVHALSREGAEELAGGEMDRRVQALERTG